MVLDDAQLEQVRAGFDRRKNAYGRCGPGTKWKFLGNYYTDA